MARSLAAATIAWALAILAAVAGVLLPGDHLPESLGLFAFAVATGVVVAVVLVADGISLRRRRRAADRAGRVALQRLEYVPPVTTATRRIRWAGSRSAVLAGWAETDAAGDIASHGGRELAAVTVAGHPGNQAGGGSPPCRIARGDRSGVP